MPSVGSPAVPAVRELARRRDGWEALASEPQGERLGSLRLRSSWWPGIPQPGQHMQNVRLL